MNITQVTNPASIWSSTTRTLTGLGSSLSPNLSGVNLTLASGSIAHFRTNAASAGFIAFIGVGTTNVTWFVGLSNGVTFYPGQSASSGAYIFVNSITGQTIGFAAQNTGSVTGTYTFTEFLLAS